MRISSPNPDIGSIEKKRQEFVALYTREYIKKMNLEQYATGTGQRDNFCYDLERKQAGMGYITGARANKFGIWYSKEEGGYKFSKRYGSTPEEAFSKIRSEILNIIDAGEKDDVEAIRANILAPLVRYKLLAMYYPYKYLTIYSREHLAYFCNEAGIPALDGDDELVMQRKLMQWHDSHNEVKDYSLMEYVSYLYNHFGHPPKKDAWTKTKPALKKLKSDLHDFDNKHPKKTLTEVERTERSGLVAAIVKERAAGVCQLCHKPAPFYNKSGDPYLECHHIVWLARGGADEPSNAVALCPNCHRKMHCLDEPGDVAKLKAAAKK